MKQNNLIKTKKNYIKDSIMSKLIFIFLFTAICLSLQADDTLVIDQAEQAGMSGFRAYWNKPVVLSAEGATKESNHGRFGSGFVADWSTGQPGAIVFDAVNRSLLIRFPDAAEAIASKLRKGAEIEKVELVLPFKDTEFFPMDYDMPAGMSFLGNTWVKEPPRWHAQAWALRRPWNADTNSGPTFNAAVKGHVFWDEYGAGNEETDRCPTSFGPAEVSSTIIDGRMNLTAYFSNPEFGANLEARLQQFSQCGLLVRKWELYDARYWKGGYEWGVATGQRGIMIGEPRLEVTFKDGKRTSVGPFSPMNVTTLPAHGKPTAVVPSEKEFTEFPKMFAFKRPTWANDWQWKRLQELYAMGGANGFPETYDAYLKWIDSMLSLHPRAWKGFSAGEMAAEYAMYNTAIPEPAKDNIRRYWWAWLMPDREFSTLVQGYIGGKEAKAYYEKTGDWRGNFSVYRTYCHVMGTVNFNSWAITGTMFGGWIIGDEGVMAEARAGYDQWMTRTWTWLDGTSQESIDHYYFAHTLGPLKVIADFAPGPEERLAGGLNVEKHVDELIACWHPNLRRFISSSGRTGVAYLLYLQDGLSYILHTLSEDGALTDVGVADVAGRKEGAFGHQLAPGQVALQSQVSPWASEAEGILVDDKPLPYEAIRSYVQWGGYSATPIWKKSYLGQNYGLASLDISQNEIVPVMAQWRRSKTKVTSWRELGTMLARYGINDTEFLDSLYHDSKTRNPNGIVGLQGGPTVTVQGRNSAIILGSPFSDLKGGVKGRPVPEKVHSLQMSMALFNFEIKPSWKLYLDGKLMSSFPVHVRFGQRITIHDGVSYLGIIPLPASAISARDIEVLISTKGEETPMQGGGAVKVTLTIDAYNYHATAPLDLASHAKAVDEAVAGFIVQMGDEAEYGSFAKFQKQFAAMPFEANWDEDAGVFHVSYGDGDARLEAGVNPTAPLSQPTTQLFPYRRFGGQWPYLEKGVHRDTTTAVQSTHARLEKNGAVLTTEEGSMACLQAFTEQDTYVVINPFRSAVPFKLELPENVTISADGLIGQSRIEVRPKTGVIDVQCVAGPASQDLRKARVLIVSGMKRPPVAHVDGRTVEAVPIETGYAIPLVTDWTTQMADTIDSSKSTIE